MTIVLWGLTGAFVAAIAYGAATILQAIGVRRLADAPAGSSLWHRALAGRLYGAGLLLDGIGFLASITALRTLPLFLVESAVASSVAITAVLAVVLLKIRLARREVLALAVVGIGLVLLAISALEGAVRQVHHHAGHWVLVSVVPIAAVALASFLIRSRGRSSAVLALVAGLSYGMVGVAARILVVPGRWWLLVTEPAFWAIVVHAVIGLVTYAYALERGRTTSVAAITFATETIAPALIGLRFLGDGVRHHHGPTALVGFVLTLGACIVLAGRAEVTSPWTESRPAD